jgi:hypothetical protein
MFGFGTTLMLAIGELTDKCVGIELAAQRFFQRGRGWISMRYAR